MHPINSVNVVVPPIGGWHKVKWLIQEDSYVKAGDRIAEIDSTEIDNNIYQERNNYNQSKSRYEEQVKKLALIERETQFKLNKAQNTFEIATLRKNTVLKGLDYPNIFTAIP